MNVTRQFPRSAQSVRDARAFVAKQLRARSVDVEDALLMVSELATNSVRHARSNFDITISWPSSRIVRIAVTDHGGAADEPRVRNPSAKEPSGRGLQIVAKLAEEWGTSRRASGGKTVWFTVPTTPRTERAAASSGPLERR